MKRSLTPKNITGISLVLMLPCLGARLWFLSAGVDELGLLPKTHFGNPLSVLLTAAACTALFFLTCKLHKTGGCSRCFPASTTAAVGGVFGTLGIGLAVVDSIGLASGLLGIFTILSGILATVACAYLTQFRSKGQRPSIMLRSSIIVFFMLYLILLYRPWSGMPHFQHYLFQVFALLCVAAANYYRACMECGQKFSQVFVFTGQAAVLLCCVAAPGSGRWPVHLALAAWMALDSCVLPPPQKTRPVADAGDTP